MTLKRSAGLSDEVVAQIEFDMQRFKTNLMPAKEMVTWFQWLADTGHLWRLPPDYHMAATRLERERRISIKTNR
jgi:hypothetical protein